MIKLPKRLEPKTKLYMIRGHVHPNVFFIKGHIYTIVVHVGHVSNYW